MNREAYMKLIEEISLNAWPSHKIELYDGWLIRFSHNYTHRTNSVQQVGASSIPVEEKVAYCEAMYANYHTPAIFKISPLLDPAFDRMLEERGYEIQHTTEVMTMDLKKLNAYEPLSVEYEYYGRNSGLPSSIYYPDETIVQLRDRITEEWINSLFRLQRHLQSERFAGSFLLCLRRFRRRPLWPAWRLMAGRWLWDWAFWTVAMWDFMRSMWTPAAGEKDWAVVSAARFSLRRKRKAQSMPTFRW